MDGSLDVKFFKTYIYIYIYMKFINLLLTEFISVKHKNCLKLLMKFANVKSYKKSTQRFWC
jgi:hypothetical protein